MPARERLNAVLRQYATAVASEFGWCMVRAEDQDLSPAMSSHIKALKSEIDQGIRRLIREGVQDGSIHPCDPKMTAFALAGALNWIAHWYRENQSMTAAEIAEAFIAVFDNGLQPRRRAAGDLRPNRGCHASARRQMSEDQHVEHEVVIVSRQAHAHRRVPGRARAGDRPQLGGAAIKAAIEAAGVTGGRHAGSDHGLRAVRGPRPGAGATGRARAPACRSARRPPHQQDVRLGTEGGDDGGGPDPRRRCRRSSLAGGLESMTNAPYLLPKARGGYRMGHGEMLDHMFYDGLQSPFDGKAMGCFADATAAKYGFTRGDRTRLPPSRCAARCARWKRASSTPRSRRSPSRAARARPSSTRDETPGTCDLDEDRDAEAGVRQGRHGDGSQLLVDLRRRGGARPHERRGRARRVG